MRYPSPSWMNSDLEFYRSNVRRFIETEITPNQHRWAKQQHVDRDLWNKAGDLGLLLADVPEEYGGSDGDFTHMSVLFEELAYAGDRSFGVHVHAIVAHYLLNQGTEEQRQKYLPKLANGTMIGAIAMSEPGAGSDLQGVRTTAVKEGNDYLINGSKIFISNGYLADLIIVVAKTDPAAGAKGTSLFLLETKDAKGENVKGFKVGRILEKLGQKGQDTCELFFDNVRVPADSLLGGVEGKGFAHLMSELPYERLMLGVGALAAVEMAIEMTLDYTKERKAFGQPIGAFQSVKHRISEMYGLVEIARANCIHAAAVAGTDQFLVAAADARLTGTEAYDTCARDCVQIHGGIGVTWEQGLHLHMRRARSLAIEQGNLLFWEDLLVEQLTGVAA